MYKVSVRSHANPMIAFLGVEEGNIDLERGIRCCVSLLDGTGVVLDKRVIHIEGEDFAALSLTGKPIVDSILDKLLQHASCERV